MLFKLPHIHEGNRIRAMALGYLYFCLIYLGAPLLSRGTPFTPPESPIDRAIPFMAWSIWPYISHYGIVFLGVWLPHRSTLNRVFWSMVATSTLACLIFVLFPSALPRYGVPTEGVNGLAWSFLYKLDSPQNCLPSLHAAMALLASLGVASRGGLWRPLAFVWLSLIGFSTLATKQHMAIDLVSGLMLGALVYWGFKRLEQRLTRPAPDAPAIDP